jgi:hypothetical protein
MHSFPTTSPSKTQINPKKSIFYLFELLSEKAVNSRFKDFGDAGFLRAHANLQRLADLKSHFEQNYYSALCPTRKVQNVLSLNATLGDKENSALIQLPFDYFRIALNAVEIRNMFHLFFSKTNETTKQINEQ